MLKKIKRVPCARFQPNGGEFHIPLSSKNISVGLYLKELEWPDRVERSMCIPAIMVYDDDCGMPSEIYECNDDAIGLIDTMLGTFQNLRTAMVANKCQ